MGDDLLLKLQITREQILIYGERRENSPEIAKTDSDGQKLIFQSMQLSDPCQVSIIKNQDKTLLSQTRLFTSGPTDMFNY